MDKEFSVARTNSLEVRGSWLTRNAPELELIVRDAELLGSRRHFIRFDLYPLYAGSYQNRHYGFWDLPLKYREPRGHQSGFDRFSATAEEKL